MTTDTHKTPVIFRMFRTLPKTCIALFPYLDDGPGRCMSYEHVGQHGGANYLSVMGITNPATPEQYADLKTELEEIGYKLEIITRRARR